MKNMGKRAETTYIKSVWVLDAFEECKGPSLLSEHCCSTWKHTRQREPDGGKREHSVERLSSAGLSRGESVPLETVSNACYWHLVGKGKDKHRARNSL